MGIIRFFAWPALILIGLAVLANSGRSGSGIETGAQQVMTDAEALKARKEAEDRCPNPEKCRQANRKAYAKAIDFKRAKELILVARANVEASLRDPDSVRFGQVFYSKKNGEAVCGDVNAKNGFGGYTGMKPFVLVVAKQKLWIDNAALWNKHCAGTEPIIPGR